MLVHAGNRFAFDIRIWVIRGIWEWTGWSMAASNTVVNLSER